MSLGTRKFISACLGILIISLAALPLSLAAPRNSTVGQYVIFLLSGGGERRNDGNSSDFSDNAPDFLAELQQYREDVSKHPLFVDLIPRLQRVFTAPPKIVDAIQYKNYVFIDYTSESGAYWLAVYAWNGREWDFISLECYTC